MMKKIIFSLITLMTCTLCADPVITLFFEPYPTSSKKTKMRALKKTKIHAGVVTSYSGNIEVSNVNGQVTFLRLNKKPEIKILVTPSYNTQPIRMIGKLVNHWELISTKKAEMFTLKLQEDPATKLSFWQVQSIDVPADKIIDKYTLIIFAKPKHIVIPTGITLSDENPNLILPTFYVKKGIKRITNALTNLSLRQFFGPVDNENRLDKKRYTHQPIPRF